MSYEGNYPAGAAHDPRAPWNEVSSPEQEFELHVTQFLEKDVIVSTDKYDYIVDVDEDGGYVEYNTEYTDWHEVLEDNRVKTPLGLIALFKECLEKQLESGNLVWSERKTKDLIEECDGWTEVDLEIEEK